MPTLREQDLKELPGDPRTLYYLGYQVRVIIRVIAWPQLQGGRATTYLKIFDGVVQRKVCPVDLAQIVLCGRCMSKIFNQAY